MASGIESHGVQGRIPSTLNEGSNDGGIFDETVSAYSSRRQAAEQLLISALADGHTKACRNYINNVQWTTVGESAILGELPVFRLFARCDVANMTWLVALT